MPLKVLSMSQTNKKPTATEARKLLWEQGNLMWKLEPTQKEFYKFIHETDSRTVVINSSRRLGKTFALLTLCVETCVKEPKQIVKFAAPTQTQITEIIDDIMPIIIKDCPESIKPRWDGKKNRWSFPNGSSIRLAGTDNKKYSRLRGGDCHLFIIDEAGFCSDLKKVISTVRPTTTTTRGKIILASTPPETESHPFVEFVKTAEARGTLLTKTIYDAQQDQENERKKNGRYKPRITADMIQEQIIEAGGEDTTDFRREFLAEIVTDEDKAVVPEFDHFARQDIIKEWTRPPFYSPYVAMDLGFKDLTVVLFGYYDFMKAKIVIEDEYIINGKKMVLDDLTLAVHQKENELWTNKLTNEVIKPRLRVADNDLIVLNEINNSKVCPGINFQPIGKKDVLEAMVNDLRQKVRSRSIVIHPRCQTLIRHIKNATWDKQRKKFSRTVADFHYDALAALIYFIRSINYNYNPYPKNYQYSGESSESVFVYRDQNSNNAKDAVEHWSKVFKLRK